MGVSKEQAKDLVEEALNEYLNNDLAHHYSWDGLYEEGVFEEGEMDELLEHIRKTEYTIELKEVTVDG